MGLLFEHIKDISMFQIYIFYCTPGISHIEMVDASWVQKI